MLNTLINTNKSWIRVNETSITHSTHEFIFVQRILIHETTLDQRLSIVSLSSKITWKSYDSNLDNKIFLLLSSFTIIAHIQKWVLSDHKKIESFLSVFFPVICMKIDRLLLGDIKWGSNTKSHKNFFCMESYYKSMQ